MILVWPSNAHCVILQTQYKTALLLSFGLGNFCYTSGWKYWETIIPPWIIQSRRRRPKQKGIIFCRNEIKSVITPELIKPLAMRRQFHWSIFQITKLMIYVLFGKKSEQSLNYFVKKWNVNICCSMPHFFISTNRKSLSPIKALVNLCFLHSFIRHVRYKLDWRRNDHTSCCVMSAVEPNSAVTNLIL